MRRFPRTAYWLLSTIVLWGCGTTREPGTVDAESEVPVVAVTRWTDATELFMEYPPLVVNQTSRFAIHLTDLATFAPVAEGRVVVALAGDTRSEFESGSPSVPGIFAVDVTPEMPGLYQLQIRLGCGAP